MQVKNLAEFHCTVKKAHAAYRTVFKKTPCNEQSYKFGNCLIQQKAKILVQKVFQVFETFQDFKSSISSCTVNLPWELDFTTCLQTREPSHGNISSNIKTISMLLALDIISDSAMGVELEAQLRNPVSLEYVANRDKVSMHTVNRFRTLWLFGDFIYYNFTPAGRDERQRIKTMHKFTENVILQRWEDLQDNFEEFQLRRKKTFLDLLLLSRNDYNLSFEDIRNEVDTFMFEGWLALLGLVCHLI